MGLGLPTGGSGDFVPFCKYNAKAGRWYSKDDAGDEFEVEKFKAYFDFANIKTGLFKFAAGQAPQQVLDSAAGSGDAVAPDGDSTFKRGFQLNVFSPKLGGVREFSSTAGVVNGPMNILYDEWLADESGNTPMVECKKVNAIEGKHGTNFEPELKITKWGKRPVEFDATPEPKQAAPAPEPEADEDDEF